MWLVTSPSSLLFSKGDVASLSNMLQPILTTPKNLNHELMIIVLMKIYNKLGSCRKSTRNQNLHSFQISGFDIIDMAKRISLLPIKKKLPRFTACWFQHRISQMRHFLPHCIFLSTKEEHSFLSLTVVCHINPVDINERL
jgi:hypothetical protein